MNVFIASLPSSVLGRKKGNLVHFVTLWAGGLFPPLPLDTPMRGFVVRTWGFCRIHSVRSGQRQKDGSKCRPVNRGQQTNGASRFCRRSEIEILITNYQRDLHRSTVLFGPASHCAFPLEPRPSGLMDWRDAGDDRMTIKGPRQRASTASPVSAAISEAFLTARALN